MQLFLCFGMNFLQIVQLLVESRLLQHILDHITVFLDQSLCSNALLQEPKVFVLLIRAHEAEATPVDHF